MKMTGAEILARLLERQGVETVAGIPGGACLPIYDALHESRITHVLARHEQGAGFIAQGMARATGRTAVCVATSGPGATNLVTAVADAKLDSVPLVAITGQVPTTLIGTDAFQEVDTFSMSLPITKHNYLVRRARDLLHVVPEAFAIAASGRPGPVWIDVPKDVQNEAIDVGEWPEPGQRAPAAEPADVARFVRILAESERPLILAGGGVVAADAHREARELSRRHAIPGATTLHGLGIFAPDDPANLGMVGMHGAGFTNRLLDEADCLVALGIRFDDRATGDPKRFCPRARIVHVDADPAEIGKIKEPELGIAADVGATLRAVLERLDGRRRPAWARRVAELREAWPLPLPRDPAASPLRWVRDALGSCREKPIVTTDVGQHQMWVAQLGMAPEPRHLLTSGGLGTMGFGLPAAIGAALACPDRRVVCVTGDGSILMNLQELDTLAELGLDVTVLILNNGHLGLVRQQQELFYRERYEASRFATAPDFAAIAESFGIPGRRLDARRDAGASFGELARTPGPMLVDVAIPPTANVLPMVPPGAGNLDMVGEREAETVTEGMAAAS